MPEAQYCGNCGFPILNDCSEEEVRAAAQDNLWGFLEGEDVKSIADSINGNQEPPADPYQWYLEEAVRKAFVDLAALKGWDWFNEGPVTELFFREDSFEDDPSDETMQDLILWANLWAFFYDALQAAGLEFSIQLGALLAEKVDSAEDIDVSVTVKPDNEDASSSGTEP